MIEETENYIRELKQMIPDFITNGPYLMKRHVLMDENVQMLWEGLQKAGLEDVR